MANRGDPPARMTFRLRAAASVKKCSWECFREGTKFRSVDVPQTGRRCRVLRLVSLTVSPNVVMFRAQCEPLVVLDAP